MPHLREGLLVIMLCSACSGSAATATPEELSEARRWVAAKFGGVQDEAPREPGLIVVANNDPVQKNARGGKPMRIADVEYTRGLYCHAHSHVVVRLPGPGESFHAVVGVDSNEQTSGGRGSVVFAVRVEGVERLRTELMREGMAGVPAEVELNGATEFVLEVGDAGDGISCDQSDWAEARVILEDGRTLWLADLPLTRRPGGPLSVPDGRQDGLT